MVRFFFLSLLLYIGIIFDLFGLKKQLLKENPEITN